MNVITEHDIQFREAPAQQPGPSAPRPGALGQALDFLLIARNWDEPAGNFEPLAIANVLGREVVIHGHPTAGRDAILAVTPRAVTTPTLLHIAYKQDHYEAYVRGSLCPAQDDDGNGLFRAVLMSLNRTKTVSPEQIADLRNRVAAEIQANRQT